MLFFSLITATFAGGRRKKSNVPYPLDSYGTHLTPDEFTEKMASDTEMLVIFHAPWCSMCKKFAPKWIEVVEKMKEEREDLFVASFDMEAHKQYGVDTFGIKSYPTLRLFKSGDVSYAMTHSKGIKAPDFIVSWANAKLAPLPYTVFADIASLATFAEVEDRGYGVMVGSFEKDDVPKWFAAAAEQSDATRFGVIAPDASPHKKGSVALYTLHSAPRVLDGVASAEGCFEGIEKFDAPPIVVFDRSDWRQRDAKWQVMIATDADMEEEKVGPLRDLAEKHRGVLKVVFIRSTQTKIRKSLQLDGVEDTPEKSWNVYTSTDGQRGSYDAKSNLALVWDRKDKASRKYPYPGLTLDGIPQWVDDVLEKEGKTHVEVLKSQEQVDPEINEKSGVKVVVGSNYLDFLARADADDAFVMLEFYADWCKHCKKLAPIYASMGELFLNESKVVLAKVNNPKNQFLPGIGFGKPEHVPTILWSLPPSATGDTGRRWNDYGKKEKKLAALTNFIVEKTTEASMGDFSYVLDLLDDVPALSEPIPPTRLNSGPVKIVVGKSFDDIVLKPGRDVVIEFYAPWCGHCKKLAPTWDKVGTVFGGNDKILIAKMDATNNEHKLVHVTSYPTIQYSAAKNKDALERLPGNGRDLDSLVNRIQDATGAVADYNLLTSQTDNKDEL
jgi:protein disulfide-isomerase-like protein